MDFRANNNHQQILSIFKELFLEICYSKRLRWMLVLSLTALLIGMIANILTPIVFKCIIDSFPTDSFLPIIWILASYGLLWTLSQVSTHVRELLTHSLVESTSCSLASRVLSHLYMLSLRQLDKTTTGIIANTVQRVQTNVPNVLWGAIFLVIPTCLELFIIITLMTIWYDPLFIAILISTIIIFVFYTHFSTGKAINSRELAINAEKDSANLIYDSLLNFETVKTFAQEKNIVSQCTKSLRRRQKLSEYSLIQFEIVRIGQVLIIGTGFTIITLLLGYGVVTKGLTLGDLVLFNGYLLQFLGPLGILGFVFRDLKKSVLELKEVVRILLIKPEITDHPRCVTLKSDELKVEFKDVCFKYNKLPILQKVTFEINPGETLALIGSTGAGKSTIAKLLLRIYDVDDGCILINGVDIRDIAIHSLYKVMGLVTQETLLLNDTISSNIAFARPQASPDEIKLALEKAELDKFINKLPEGLNTIVGERGMKLSGGQRQRISLARLFLHAPKIYVFDEPTSSLDYSTAENVMTNIKGLCYKSTAMIITHDKNLLTNINRVLKIDKGGVIKC